MPSKRVMPSKSFNQFDLLSLGELVERLNFSVLQQKDVEENKEAILTHLWRLLTCPANKINSYYKDYVPHSWKLILAYYLTGGKLITSAGLAGFDLYNTIIKIGGGGKPEAEVSSTVKAIAYVWTVGEVMFNGYACYETRTKVLRDWAEQVPKKDKTIKLAHVLKATKSYDLEALLLKILGAKSNNMQVSKKSEPWGKKYLLIKTKCVDGDQLIDTVLPCITLDGVEESDEGLNKFLCLVDSNQNVNFETMAQNIMVGRDPDKKLVEALRGVFNKVPDKREYEDFYKLKTILSKIAEKMEKKRLVIPNKILVNKQVLNKVMFYNNYCCRLHLKGLYKKLYGEKLCTEAVYLEVESCLHKLDRNSVTGSIIDEFLHCVSSRKYIFNINESYKRLSISLEEQESTEHRIDISENNTPISIQAPYDADDCVMEEEEQNQTERKHGDVASSNLLDLESTKKRLFKDCCDVVRINGNKKIKGLMRSVFDAQPVALSEEEISQLLKELTDIEGMADTDDRIKIQKIMVACGFVLLNVKRLHMHMGSKYERLSAALYAVFEVPISEQDPESFVTLERMLNRAKKDNSEIIRRVHKCALAREKQYYVKQIQNNQLYDLASKGLYGISWFGTTYAVLTGALGADKLIDLIPKIGCLLNSDNSTVSLTSKAVYWAVVGSVAVCGGVSFERFQAKSMYDNVAEFLYIFKSLFNERGRTIFAPTGTSIRMGVGLILAIVLGARAAYDLTNSMDNLGLPTAQLWVKTFTFLFWIGYMNVQVFAQIVKGVTFDDSKLKGLRTNMPHTNANKVKIALPSTVVLSDSLSYSVGAGVSMLMLIASLKPILGYVLPFWFSQGIAVIIGFAATLWPSLFFTFHEKFFEVRQNRYNEKEIQQERVASEALRQKHLVKSRNPSVISSQPATPPIPDTPSSFGVIGRWFWPKISDESPERSINAADSPPTATLDDREDVTFDGESRDIEEHTGLTSGAPVDRSGGGCSIM